MTPPVKERAGAAVFRLRDNTGIPGLSPAYPGFFRREKPGKARPMPANAGGRTGFPGLFARPWLSLAFRALRAIRGRRLARRARDRGRRMLTEGGVRNVNFRQHP
jgi:hypothetical protein